jgi:prepilin-type N-terminal cleavage/methylation domain-containing protein/prepilin-type processing-associated H-X9-DG protein
MRHQSHNRPRAFTLVELLVVVGIIALLIGILMPALSAARQNAQGVQCLSNLRQMMIAAQMYVNAHRGSYPISFYRVVDGTTTTDYVWDFTTITDAAGNRVVPGLLWSGATNLQVQQCPSFDGRSNTSNNPYTGYNYNASYVGGEQLGPGVYRAPVKSVQIGDSTRTAIFGDGEYTGANKHMRAPFYAPGEPTVARWAGTQGFRQRARTNVAFADGHAETMADRFTNTYAGQVPHIRPRTGFLSADNALYDPE